MAPPKRLKKQYKPIGFGDPYDPHSVEGHQNAAREARETRETNNCHRTDQTRQVVSGCRLFQAESQSGRSSHRSGCGQTRELTG